MIGLGSTFPFLEFYLQRKKIIKDKKKSLVKKPQQMF